MIIINTAILFYIEVLQTTFDYRIDKLESTAKNCEKIGLNQYAPLIIYNDYLVQGSAERLLEENEIKHSPDESTYMFNSNVYYGTDA